MKDSCEPPSPDGIWSLFSLMLQIPQEINGWVTSGPQALAPPLFCPAFLYLGDQQVNCKSRTASASHRRRSIGTSRPREPRIHQAFDNGRSTPKTGRSRRVSVWRRLSADTGHSTRYDLATGPTVC
jgi:hypothetical protein